jgi:hypothetical protein
VTVRSSTGLDVGILRGPVGRRPNTDVERTPVAGRIQRPPQLSHSEIHTVARRLQHASDTMGVHITRAFAERMATEGLCRSGEVGMVKTPDTVIFFAESADRGGVTVLGWADEQTFLDRFASLQLVPNPAATASLDPGPVDNTGPEL